MGEMVSDPSTSF